MYAVVEATKPSGNVIILSTIFWSFLTGYRPFILQFKNNIARQPVKVSGGLSLKQNLKVKPLKPISKRKRKSEGYNRQAYKKS